MYFIDNKIFKSQKEIKNFLKNLFENNGFGKANIITHNFLLELIKRHPDYKEKYGVGISCFNLLQNPLIKTKNFYITFIRDDGSKDDFSYNMCITRKKKSLKNETLNAMRNSIKNDIIIFKNQTEKKCNICYIKDVDFDCDHYGIEFKELSENFIKINGLCNEFKNDGFFTCFSDNDKNYKNEWVKYHNENCMLQLLCKKCHINKK